LAIRERGANVRPHRHLRRRRRIDKLTSGTLNKSILSTSIGHANLINGREPVCDDSTRSGTLYTRISWTLVLVVVIKI
jgi:hypothetical protein